MSDTNFASLSPSLLARKGGAKPAMRPQSGMQGPVDGAAAAANLEDLGWNDMGDEAPATSAQVVAISPMVAGQAANNVRESLDRITAHIERQSGAAPTPRAANAPVRKPAIVNSRRAAFTLRLDNERHLQLRLACTVRGRSAQQLVTDALDALLAEMPEIANLAAQVKQRGN